MHHDLALKQMPHWDENRTGVSWIKAKACKLWIKWTIVRRLTNRALFRVDKAALAGKMSTIGKWTRNDIVPCAPNLPKAILEKEWDKPRTNDKKKDMKEYVPGTNTRESFQADFDLSWVLMAHDFKLQRGARTSMTSSAGVTPCIRIFSCTGFSQFRRVRYKPLPWARKKLAHLSAVANGVPALLGWMTWRCDRGNFTHTV